MTSSSTFCPTDPFRGSLSTALPTLSMYPAYFEQLSSSLVVLGIKTSRDKPNRNADYGSFKSSYGPFTVGLGQF